MVRSGEMDLTWVIYLLKMRVTALYIDDVNTRQLKKMLFSSRSGNKIIVSHSILGPHQTSLSHGSPKGSIGPQKKLTPKELVGAFRGTYNCHRNVISSPESRINRTSTLSKENCQILHRVSVRSSLSAVKNVE